MAGKVETYVGFCLRARKISLGAGTIDFLKKGVYLIMVCSTASDNAKKTALKFKNRFSCPMIECKTGLENVVHKQGCKIAAIRDENLARAICDNLDGDYVLCDGGNK